MNLPFSRLSLLLIWALLGAADTASATYIRINGYPGLTFTVSGEQLTIGGTYEMVNEGDEQARGVFPHFTLGRWSWAGDEKLLDPHQRETWNVEATIALSDLECATDGNDFCAGQKLPLLGAHPLLIRRHYQAANGYRYTAAEVMSVVIGALEGDALVAARAPGIQSRLRIGGDGQEFSGELALQSGSRSAQKVAAAFLVPQELQLLTAPTVVDLKPNGDATVPIELKNFSGLDGSSYAVFSVLQWEQFGVRNVSIASATAEIKTPKKPEYSAYAIVGVLVLSGLLLYVFVFRK